MAKPWLMEPGAATVYANAFVDMLQSGGLPAVDKRPLYTDTYNGTDRGYAFRVNAKGSLDENGVIQVLRINGPILKQDYCGAPGSQTFQQLLAAANADDGINGTVLWMDSPGGQVDGTEAFANAIAASEKPVVTYADGTLCSAAYWIASASRQIITAGANNGWNDTIGSIGTMAIFKDDAAKMEKEGVKVNLIFADASTDKWGDIFKIKSGDFTRIKAELNGINDTFLAAVKKNRAGLLALDKENVLTGKTYNAKEAIRYGLVDKIGTFTDAVKAAVNFSKAQKSKINSRMEPFKQTLVASKGDAFEVTDNGFLATEEQLKNIEAHITQQEALLSAAATQINGLTAKVKEMETAAEEATTTATALTEATSKLSETEQALQKAQAQIVAMEKSFGFKQTDNGGQDPKPGHEDDPMAAVNSFSHNKTADSLL